MCALTSLEYEFSVKNILSKINKKNKQDFRKVVKKDQNGNR